MSKHVNKHLLSYSICEAKYIYTKRGGGLLWCLTPLSDISVIS